MQSVFLEKIIKLLQENGTTLEEFAKKLNLRNFNLLEHNYAKGMPPAEIIAEIAKELNVTTDYLLLDNAPRNPLIFGDARFSALIQKVPLLPFEDQKALQHIIEALIARNEFVSLAAQMKVRSSEN